MCLGQNTQRNPPGSLLYIYGDVYKTQEKIMKNNKV